jgi:hypothetical protein
MPEQCVGKIKIPKRLLLEGVDDRCHNFAFKVCPVCRGWYCHNHIKKDKHECVEEKT